MPYLGDYRRKGYTILALICLVLIYFKLYSKSNDEKTKQILSSGLIDFAYKMHISYLPTLFSHLTPSLAILKQRSLTVSSLFLRPNASNIVRCSF